MFLNDKYITMRKLILLIIFVLAITFTLPSYIFASSPTSLQGEARVENTGTSLTFEDNNSNVTVDPETGVLTGYAWSEDLGWVDFTNAENPPTINLETYNVTGEAGVLNTGGKLYFTGFSSNVTFDNESNTFSGYAWSEDVGWVDFSGVSLSGELAETGMNVALIQMVAVGLIVLLTLLYFNSRYSYKLKN